MCDFINVYVTISRILVEAVIRSLPLHRPLHTPRLDRYRLPTLVLEVIGQDNWKLFKVNFDTMVDCRCYPGMLLLTSRTQE